MILVCDFGILGFWVELRCILGFCLDVVWLSVLLVCFWTCCFGIYGIDIAGLGFVCRFVICGL